MKVLVTGASGGLGRQLLGEARPPGMALRAFSRRARAGGAGGVDWRVGDLGSGEGVVEAVAGVDVVIHAASDPRSGGALDAVGTARLLEAAAAAGVGHVVYVSIVGIDEIPHRYYRQKLAAERVVAAGAVPWSILRVAQFHSYIAWQIARAARVPLVLPLPLRYQFQSVATGDVARRLLRCLADGPHRRLRDFVGPEVMTLEQAATAWKEVKGVRKPLVNLPLPGRVAAAFRAGKNTAPGGERGSLPWRDWLLAREAAARAARSDPAPSAT
jgi:uncharacterized protein YbjT (DUF2867 family)